MCLNSIIVILDLLEKILGKGANHEKIKKHILATSITKYKSKEIYK